MMALSARIRANMEQVQERIERSARVAGRDTGEIRLVVVSKAQPVEVVRAALDAGATIFGENYPEETLPKMQAIDDERASWHMIGHLQSRKAGLVAERFDLLQSLDSVRLAEKLDRRLTEVGRRLPVLLEMNVGGEDSKFGWQMQDEARWEAILPDIEAIAALPNLEIRGLMTMPPYNEDAERTRPFFKRLRKLSQWLAARYPQLRFTELSMGTSVDFDVAVQEGATYVRVGELILGPRPKRGEEV